MSETYGSTKEYFDFAADVMEELHDVAALLNSVNLDCLEELELELEEAGNTATRLLSMAINKVNSIVNTIDESSFAYRATTDEQVNTFAEAA